MAESEISLIFIPCPGVGHLTSTVEFAKILLSGDPRLSITLLVIHSPGGDSSVEDFIKSVCSSASDRLHFLDVPKEESEPVNFLNFIESKKPAVKKLASDIRERYGPRLAGFVVDMFCSPMIEVATEFGVPSYLYYTSNASFLALLLFVQKLCDDEGLDVADFKDSEAEFPIPRFLNPIPARLMPSMAFEKENGFSANFLGKVRAFRKTNGILVNSFIELESHAVESMSLELSLPPVYPIGPVVNMDSRTTFIKPDKETEIMKWLDGHPPASVIFLCFGSMGSFGPAQVKEIARGLEASGCRFLWSLRKPSSGPVIYAAPEDYDDFSVVLPEGFLERTNEIGKMIGWAPQTAVLGHQAVVGFVSHCGWNSTLEALWFGVPMVTWPLYAEQQLNAFWIVKEFGIGVEITLDYRGDVLNRARETTVVSWEQIERGVRKVMEPESEVRKKVKLMMQKCREAISEGGSSYVRLHQFIDDLRKNIGV